MQDKVHSQAVDVEVDPEVTEQPTPSSAAGLTVPTAPSPVLQQPGTTTNQSWTPTEGPGPPPARPTAPTDISRPGPWTRSSNRRNLNL